MSEEFYRIKRLPPYVFAGIGSRGFAKALLAEAEAAVAPGIGFGEYGEGPVRRGLVENAPRRQAARGLRRAMQNAGEIVARYRAGAGMTGDGGSGSRMADGPGPCRGVTRAQAHQASEI